MKEIIILLMQHSISRKPIDELTVWELESASDMLQNLINFSCEEPYTQVDYIQMARLMYAYGYINYKLGDEMAMVELQLVSALQHLQRGGIDLSMQKWLELVSVRTEE